MLSWLTANPIVSENWMGEELYKTLLSYLSDGLIDESEEEKLIILLTKITGSPSVNLSGQNATTTLPLHPSPPDKIIIDGHDFVITGNFKHSTRKGVTNYIEQRGGSIKKTPSGNTDYLVLGETGSAAWIQSNSGRKIQRAAELYELGNKICIISEEHFFKSTTHTQSIEPALKLSDEEIFQQLITILQKNEQLMDALENTGLLFHIEPIYLAAYQTFKNGKPKKSPCCEIIYDNNTAEWVIENEEEQMVFSNVNNAFKKFINSIN
ncbi:MAG: BRCT domain-containing protein [Opitutaceae bacterium]|nr:BRCT domain-containing protein [Opitutaceae bacterium]